MQSTTKKIEFRLVEPLTPRERDVLTLLAQHLRYQDIAEQLSMSINSIKWYAQQIYDKLSVDNRRDAIQRARALGLLETEQPAPSPRPRHNLPRQLTSFIGREKEIEQVVELARQNALVTLTGSGGVGKTRLALSAAGELVGDFTHGAWLVELAPLNDPEMTAQFTASALGLREVTGQNATQALIDHLASKDLLLVLDNCEHVISAAAELVDQLLRVCPQIHILATSREVLGVAGEIAYRCPSLALPDPGRPLPFNELTRFEALRLFIERAQTSVPGFPLSERNALVVAQICQRLDGIPLAIELAAARVKLLSVEQISERLDDVFPLLTGGARTALPHHQTLKALIDWSYHLLPGEEQRLLQRLSVFAGGWNLEAAEKVCADGEDGSLPHSAILDRLSQLVDKSLVVVYEDRRGAARYRMLEMIRQYARDRLAEAGEDAAVRERHLEYFTGLALQAEKHLRAKGSREWVERMEGELDNLRLAMEWSLSGHVEKGLLLAAALQDFWHGTYHRMEGCLWLNQLLAAEEAGRSSDPIDAESEIQRQIARGKALLVNAAIRELAGFPRKEMNEEALAIFQPLAGRCPTEYLRSMIIQEGTDTLTQIEMARKTGDIKIIADALNRHYHQTIWEGDFIQARASLVESIACRREAGDLAGEAADYARLGILEFMEGSPSRANELFLTNKAYMLASGSDEWIPLTLSYQAWVALAMGDYQQALDLSQEGLRIGKENNIHWVIVFALGFCAWSALCLHEEEQAEQYCHEALKWVKSAQMDVYAVCHYVLARIALMNDKYGRSFTCLKEFILHNMYNWPPVQLGIQQFGMLALAQAGGDLAQARRAAVLLGAQDDISAKLLNVIPPLEREAYHQAVGALRSLLSEKDLAVAWEEGRAMTTRQAIDYALKESGLTSLPVGG